MIIDDEQMSYVLKKLREDLLDKHNKIGHLNLQLEELNNACFIVEGKIQFCDYLLKSQVRGKSIEAVKAGEEELDPSITRRFNDKPLSDIDNTKNKIKSKKEKD
ncbi:MAG TPA: hypothetical protein VMX55_04020 [candidate division Zixibacteria bacterium]|nr:hypothetical protein [candidate division Zixibacteria bacterium]